MPNWCRNTLLAVGTESEVSRFVTFAGSRPGEEGTTFAERFEPDVLHREPGFVRLEAMSRWVPPFEALADVSRQFPALRFAVEWEEPGNQLYGCACIQNGDGEVVYLDELMRLVCGNDDDDDVDEDRAMLLRWEVMRATSSHLFGGDWKHEGGPWGGASKDLEDTARQLAMENVAERHDLAEEIRRCRQGEVDFLEFLRSLEEVRLEKKIRWQEAGF